MHSGKAGATGLAAGRCRGEDWLQRGAEGEGKVQRPQMAAGAEVCFQGQAPRPMSVPRRKDKVWEGGLCHERGWKQEGQGRGLGEWTET